MAKGSQRSGSIAREHRRDLALGILSNQKLLTDLYDHFLVQEAFDEGGRSISWRSYLFGKLDETDCLLTTDGREAVEEIVQGLAPPNMIDESLHRNTRPFETGFAAHAVRIDPDDFIKLSFLFWGHDLKFTRNCQDAQGQAGFWHR
jgi:hypothetical protein